MSALTVQVVGTRGVVASFDKFYLGAKFAIEDEVDAALKNIEADAKRRVPKKTGELMSTIRREKKKGDLFGYVLAGFGKIRRRADSKARGSHSKDQTAKGIYAAVVEFGSKDKRHPRQARPYLFPAWRLEKTPFDNRLKKALADVAAKVMSGNSSAVSS